MSEKDVRRYLRREFCLVGWVLVLYYVIMNIMVTAAVGYNLAGSIVKSVLLHTPPEITVADLMRNGWGYIGAVAVGLVVLINWKGSDYFVDVLSPKGRKMTGKAFFSILCIFLSAQILGSLCSSLINILTKAVGIDIIEQYEKYGLNGTDSFSMFLYASILAPISEELLFRGFVQRTLLPYGRKFAVFCSALLFGIFHGNLVQTPFAFIAGLILGYVALEYNLLWSIALHMINNLVFADLLGCLTGLWPAIVAIIIESIVVYGIGMIGLILIFLKRRAIYDYIRSDWMDRQCLRCFFTNSGVIVFLMIFGASMVSSLFI